MRETLKEWFNHDDEFQEFIEKLPELFTYAQKITTKHTLTESNLVRQTLSQ